MPSDAPDRIWLGTGPTDEWDLVWTADFEPSNDGLVEYVRSDKAPIPPDGSICWYRSANRDFVVDVDAPDRGALAEVLSQVIRDEVDP